MKEIPQMATDAILLTLASIGVDPVLADHTTACADVVRDWMASHDLGDLWLSVVTNGDIVWVINQDGETVMDGDGHKVEVAVSGSPMATATEMLETLDGLNI